MRPLFASLPVRLASLASLASLAALAACSADGRDAYDPSVASSPASPAGGDGDASARGGDPSGGGGATDGGGGGGGGATDGGGGGATDGGGGGSTDGGTGDGGSNVGPAGPTPWETSPCGGGAISQADVLSHFAPAATTTTFGTVWVDARKRQCQDQTGCQGWTPASSVDLYRIVWNGNGFNFPASASLPIPSATGTITCTVPGPSCTLSVGAMSSNVYPAEQGRPLGITPRVGGSQVQVGNWSSNPQGNYVQYTSSVVTPSCLWGTMSGRVYGASATYVETQMVVWGTH